MCANRHTKETCMCAKRHTKKTCMCAKRHTKEIYIRAKGPDKEIYAHIFLMRSMGVDVIARKEKIRVHHRLKLQCVVRRVLKKHSPLLTRFVLKTLLRRNHELDTRCLNALGKFVEFVVIQYNPEVWNRYLITIYGVEVLGSSIVSAYPMAHNLVSIQREVDPFSWCTSTLRASHDTAPEAARGVEVMHGEGKMEGLPRRRARLYLEFDAGNLLGLGRLRRTAAAKVRAPCCGGLAWPGQGTTGSSPRGTRRPERG
mmetsp:Transcript_52416/g.84826  ORF Transcript_52416/g.84826 Transcript_52416/m.84826 type:complete len:256 (-) Transcript_52416:62-829(-)